MSEKLYWISVGGHKCEPARVVFIEGDATGFYSIGCNDLHPLDGVVLVREITGEAIPYTPAQEKAQATINAAAWQKATYGAGYRYRCFE